MREYDLWELGERAAIGFSRENQDGAIAAYLIRVRLIHSFRI